MASEATKQDGEKADPIPALSDAVLQTMLAQDMHNVDKLPTFETDPFDPGETYL